MLLAAGWPSSTRDQLDWTIWDGLKSQELVYTFQRCYLELLTFLIFKLLIFLILQHLTLGLT